MEKIPSTIHSSWHKHLEPLFNDVKMIKLKNEILPNSNFYPEANNIFRVFNMPLDQIRVVILGQDPYPNGEANGLAFSVNENCETPASLKIIKREVGESAIPPIRWKTLQHWSDQGVFLLNTALTVQRKKPSSHSGYWLWFTKHVIETISKNNPCVWLLWGSKAQMFRGYVYRNITYKTFKDSTLEQLDDNVVLTAPHPAAEMYSDANKKFSGCNHFNLCNDILLKSNKKIINW